MSVKGVRANVGLIQVEWHGRISLIDPTNVLGVSKQGISFSNPDSPLGPYAFHEYETLLLQDYEELVKKCVTKSRQSEVGNFKEKLTFEDDGWSRLMSSEEDTPHLEATSSVKDFYEDNPFGPLEDVGQTLILIFT
ncbi:hypothetical protein QYF36_006096 [Acer negundo]|nr:hypothetical protein QYF36_006096 [Acer negundo]